MGRRKKNLGLSRQSDPLPSHCYSTGELVYRCGKGKLYRVDWDADCLLMDVQEEVKVVCLETGVAFGIHISEIRKTTALEYLAAQAE